MSTVLPMFPLGSVLVPGAFLPLHVFEPRYRALVRDCLDGTPEFGVALIERGFEVGGGDARFDVGCVARIVEAVPFPDGRWAIGAVGDRRVRVERWLDDDPYPRAEVADWPDPPPAGELDVAPLVADLRRALALAAELGEAAAPATVELADDAEVALWQVAAVAPIGPLDRLDALRSPSPDARLELLRQALDDAVTMLAARVAGG